MGQTAVAVTDALRSATAGAGAIGVIQQVRLGRALSDRGHEVIQIVDGQKGRVRAGEHRVQGRPEALPMGDGELAAVVGLGMGQRNDWEAVLREWRRVVAQGGVVIAVDRAPPVELTRRLLCAGLTAIEQRRARGQTITSGRVLRP